MAITAPHASAPLTFGRFELQTDERRLLVDGQPVVIGARAFDLLAVLAARPGRLVTKQELLELVWPGLVVEENNIAVQVRVLRKLLGGDVIDTIPGCGYRLVARPSVGAETPERIRAPGGAQRLQTNLPHAMVALLGRVDALAVLDAMVDRHRLVTITGAGGIGKSVLTQHLLEGRRTHYPHGVCWVELANVTDPAALPGTIAAALGVQPGGGEPIARLADAVAPLQVLVALDNAEHLIGAVALLVDRLLEAAPGLRLIVTSQAPLRAAGEHVYRLEALAVPDKPLPADQALGYGAVALFVDRAQAVDGRFTFSDANAPAVIALCRELDGLALAIELAAARAPMLGVQRLVDSMHDRLKLLTASRNHAAPPRQQTLRAALEWSHGLLDAAEQAVFRRLAVVSGSASLELVQQIAADPTGVEPIDAWDVLDALAVLVERSLVMVIGTDDETRPRYRLLDSPRAYATERLAHAGEVEAVRGRFVRALAMHYDQAWHQYLNEAIEMDRWRRNLVADLDNGRDAMAWAIETQQTDAALLIGSMLLRVVPRSQHKERAGFIDACALLIDQAGSPPIKLRGWLALAISYTTILSSRFRASAEQALALARVAGTGAQGRRELYLALAAFTAATGWSNDLQAAEAAFAELRALEDPSWPAQCLAHGAKAEAALATAQRNPAHVLRASQRSLELALRSGDGGMMARVNLIDAELAAGKTEAALHTATTLVDELAKGRDEHGLAYARVNLCEALLAAGEVPRARQVALAGWRMASRFELQPYWADCLTSLAALEGRFEVAARLAGFGSAIYAKRGEARQTNPAKAYDHACSAARAVLGDALLERLRREGAALRDDDIATLAFDPEGPGPWPASPP